MHLWKAALLTALLGAGGFGAAVVWFSRRWILPPRVQFDPPHSDWVEEVSFSSTDGVPLAGWLFPGEAGRPALVLCHGYQRCMEETFSLGVALRERGYSVLLFDFRGCGRSGGRYTTIGAFEDRDLLGAVAWLRDRLGPGTPVGVHGISMGGAVAIRAAARCEAIAAVAVDSAFAHLAGAVAQRFATLRFPRLQLHQLTMLTAERMCGGRVAWVRPVDDVRRIAPRPLLFIHGTEDEIVPHGHVDELYAAAGEPKEMWRVPDSAHAMARFDAPDEYLERVAGFFERALQPRRAAAG